MIEMTSQLQDWTEPHDKFAAPALMGSKDPAFNQEGLLQQAQVCLSSPCLSSILSALNRPAQLTHELDVKEIDAQCAACVCEMLCLCCRAIANTRAVHGCLL